MAKLRVHAFTISLDGYGAGPDQSRENPLGVGGEELHEWMFPTRTFQQMQGKEGGTTGVEDELTRRGFEHIGAWILGRNMFAPSRGPWPDDGWKGWWGDDPPYHGPVFVLTHHPHAPIPMEGGTTFHFVTDGVHAALQRAVEAAGGRDVRIGGVGTIRQYLAAGLIDGCTSPSRRSSSAPESISSPGSTRPSSATGSPSTVPQPAPRTWS